MTATKIGIFVIALVTAPWMTTTAFSTRSAMTSHHPSISGSRFPTTTTTLSYSVHDENKPMQCFLVVGTQQDDDEDDDNNNLIRSPRVICTSQPEEYAWFYGIDQENLVKTDGIHAHAHLCVEGESPRGVPEWECQSAFQ
jgi:hypothetical protein